MVHKRKLKDYDIIEGAHFHASNLYKFPQIETGHWVIVGKGWEGVGGNIVKTALDKTREGEPFAMWLPALWQHGVNVNLC